MEMTIDFAIQRLQAERNNYKHDTVSNWALSLDIALDTMHKYEKIEQIIRKYDVTWEFHHMKPTIDEIRKVIEDGKND